MAGGLTKISEAHEERPDRVDPHLWAESKKAGGQKVPVIIQVAGPGQDGELLLKRHGIKADDQFGFIGGYRAELPAAVVERLGRDEAVRYISLDAPVELHGYDLTPLQTVYNQVAGVADGWNMWGLTGRGISVAVLDTGVNSHDDIKQRLTVVRTNIRAMNGNDANGHGTHVAGIIAGRAGNGAYLGAAPEANIIAIKIADDLGRSSEGDLLRGLQWVYDNRSAYNIRVVNLSVSASQEVGYRQSAIDAAVEQLWRAGIVVVVASGNRGNAEGAVNFPPANDPFVITVGALDDAGTLSAADDSLASFSSYGTTQDGFKKPEIVAPGRKIVSLLGGPTVTLAKMYPDRVTGTYIRLSGTSMSAPVVAGAVALLLERYPQLTPDQVKYLLVGSGQTYPGRPVGTAPLINLRSALELGRQMPVPAANQGLAWNPGIDPATGAVNWGNAYWENAYWENAYWENAYPANADYMFFNFD
jgi:serine protease AprX